MSAMDVLERFSAKVDASGGSDACWLWNGAKDWDGYGKFRFQGKIRTASSVALHMATGLSFEKIGECRHSCDRPNCCNPKHLSPGTHADNMQDKKAKGRIKQTQISKSNKLEIQRQVMNGSKDWCSLSEKYGVTPRRIRQIAQEVIGVRPARCNGEKVHSSSSGGSESVPPKHAAKVRFLPRRPRSSRVASRRIHRLDRLARVCIW